MACHHLRHDTCVPNYLLEGWKLGRGSQYRVLVKAGPDTINAGVRLLARTLTWRANVISVQSLPSRGRF